MKIAFCAIVKASDDEAKVLKKLLQNVSPYVDGIFITITGKNKAVEKVAKSYKAVISHFKWINDFAAARNFNFSQVPKEYDYIFWADADDMFRGLMGLKNILKENPNVDAFVMKYLYAFDEDKQPIVVHNKTQIVKNDGCVEWVGQLHEDFRETRNINAMLIDSIERLHITDENRINIAKKRNLEVAEHQLEVNPEDPRSYWNVANSLKSVGKDEEAIEMFKKFLEKSHSDDEKYIVYLRLAECYIGLQKTSEAIDAARFAIGIKPHFPDAYFALGHIYMGLDNYGKAAEYWYTGILKPKPYHKIIVYNPREYDYVPMYNLAKCYFSLSRPDLALPLLEGCLKIYPNNEKLKKTIELIKKETEKFDQIINEVKAIEEEKDDEKLKEKINSLPLDIRSHPVICRLYNTRFIKQESSGKDLVIFCGFTEEEWTPETAKTKGIGGSEEAVIWLSRLLKNRGWNVTVYNACGAKQLEFDGVIFKPWWMWNYRDKQDVTVLWRSPKMCDYDINSTKIFVDLHDVIKPGEFNEKRLAKIDKIFVKSRFHRSLFPNIPDDKFNIVPNGIDYHLFSENNIKQPLIINTSSPDRSLSAYIDIVREVKKSIPGVKAVWAYGWNVFNIVNGDNTEGMKWRDDIEQGMKEVGIENLGRLGHEEVAKLYKSATVFLYPSEFAEIDCISLTKAMAAGAYPITTDFAAMGEKSTAGGVFIHSDKTKDNWCPPGQIDHALKDYDKKMTLAQETISVLLESRDTSKLQTFAMAYDWENIADIWNKLLYV